MLPEQSCLGSVCSAGSRCLLTQPGLPAVIVKASSGPRYVVGCRNKVDKAKLTAGTRVALDMTTLTIMRALPREVRPSASASPSAAAALCGACQQHNLGCLLLRCMLWAAVAGICTAKTRQCRLCNTLGRQVLITDCL